MVSITPKPITLNVNPIYTKTLNAYAPHFPEPSVQPQPLLHHRLQDALCSGEIALTRPGILGLRVCIGLISGFRALECSFSVRGFCNLNAQQKPSANYQTTSRQDIAVSPMSSKLPTSFRSLPPWR